MNNILLPAQATGSLLPKQQELIVDNFFSLVIAQKLTATTITMQLYFDQVNTSDIPMIVDLLKIYLPNVLTTQCFNDDGYSFKEEVRHTELGHLFEHILLEYLCQLKMAKGCNKACFSGRTKWNWIRDPKGKFYIHINCGLKDADILPEAIEKTSQLMRIILSNHQTPLFYLSPEKTANNGLKNGRRTRKTISA